MKVIWTLLVLGVAWWMWRRWSVAKGLADTSARPQTGPSPQGPAVGTLPPARMVQCAHCGVHLPESDALLSRGRHYCGQSHLEAAERVA